MSTKIILVGGMLDTVTHDSFVARLARDVPFPASWEWVWSRQAEQYQPSRKAMMRLLDQLRQWKVAKEKSKHGGPAPSPESLTVLKLFDLHGRATHGLRAIWPDLKHVPADIRTSDKVIEWLRSPDAALFPPDEWLAGITEAAIVAILCKLIKNHDWNPDVQGHNWTKEVDLLNQAPVQRNNEPQVAIEARRILKNLRGTILLTKGANQGNTPREWSINSHYLPQIKQAILGASLDALAEIDGLAGFLRRIDQQERSINLLGEVVTDGVKEICRSQF
jgi:hypothetical protein